MSSALRTALVLLGIFAAVVLASVFYSRVLRETPVVETAPRPTPAVADSAALHPAIGVGLAALQDSRPEDARTSFESVPATDASYLIAQGHLAEAMIRGGDVLGGIRVLENLAAIQPDSPAILEPLAWGYYRAGDLDRAELCALRAIEVDPGQARLRYALGLFRLSAGRTVEAIPVYKRAMEADVRQEHARDALARLFGLRIERPDLPGVHYALAFFASAMKRPELEREELERFLAQETAGPLADKARSRLADLAAEPGAIPAASPTP